MAKQKLYVIFDKEHGLFYNMEIYTTLTKIQEDVKALSLENIESELEICEIVPILSVEKEISFKRIK